MVTTIKVTGAFSGPDFVNGLSKQKASYTIVSSTRAMLTFAGGLDPSVTYQMILKGTGFGIDTDGRYVGVATGFKGVNLSVPDTHWVFSGFQTLLDVMNTNASSTSVTFEDLLVSPLAYKFNGDTFDDTFAGGPFEDLFIGKAGDDSFSGLSGDDTFKGGTGNDSLSGDEGNDTVYGAAGDDIITGGSGADLLYGADGNDTISGGTDPDEIYGGSGNDTLNGEAGSDTIKGGSGVDHIYGGEDSDAISGAAGDDILEGGPGSDTLSGGNGADMLSGEIGADFLSGGKGKDSLFGGDGIDTIGGNRGEDVLAGGDGSDALTGGAGDDTLSGNISTAVVPDDAFDAFAFNGAFGHDTITDFEIGFDTITIGGGIRPRDVTVADSGNDVLITVAYQGTQTILVQGVAAHFNANADILFS